MKKLKKKRKKKEKTRAMGFVEEFSPLPGDYCAMLLYFSFECVE